MVYVSATLSLAALEFFVHLDPDVRPNDLVAISADVPDDLTIAAVKPSALPKSWRAYPPPEELQEMGDSWIRKTDSAVLSVPSVVIPHERNFLINPAHSDFRRLHIGSPQPSSFDPRIWKS